MLQNYRNLAVRKEWQSEKQTYFVLQYTNYHVALAMMLSIHKMFPTVKTG